MEWTILLCVLLIILIVGLPYTIERSVYRALLKLEALKQGKNPGGDLGKVSFQVQSAAREQRAETRQ